MRHHGLAVACGLALCAGLACQSAPGVPVADGTVVTPSPTLRQGQDAITVVLTRSAGGLTGATAFELGGLTVTAQPNGTDTRLVLVVAVPHGAALGSRTLTFTDAHGAVSVPDVVEVDAITASPAGTDANVGTSAAPFRTIQRALSVAGAGDTIQLLDGAYDATTGEIWSYTLPAGLTIAGQSTAGTTLTGPLVGGAPIPGTTGLIAHAGVTLKTLTLSAFDTAVSATGAGMVALTDVDVSNVLTTAVDANAAGVTVTVAGGALSAQQNAILLDEQCASCVLDVTNASLAGALMQGHTIGISSTATGSRVTLQQANVLGDLSVMAPTATLAVSGCTFKEDESAAQTTIDFGGQELDVSDSTLTLRADNFGINLASGTLTLTSSTITGGNYGVYQLGGTAKVRGTKIQGYGYMGYYLAQGDLDLGTATEAGNNAFSTSTTGPLVFGLYVDGIVHPVTSSNTTFNGVEPPAGTQSAAPDEMISVPGEYFINFGKAISFWTL